MLHGQKNIKLKNTLYIATFNLCKYIGLMMA